MCGRTDGWKQADGRTERHEAGQTLRHEAISPFNMMIRSSCLQILAECLLLHNSFCYVDLIRLTLVALSERGPREREREGEHLD